MTESTVQPNGQRNVRLYERCKVLADIVRVVKPIYSSLTATGNQRQLIETMIGAAIWYFPQPPELWTGKISAEAAKTVQAGKKATRDHQYPRKVAARELLVLADSELTADAIYSLYWQTFGRFNLVTKEENRKLMRHQRVDVFVSPERCYADAGIVLIDGRELKVAVDAVQKSSTVTG